MNVEVKVMQARGLPKADQFGKIDPYFILSLGTETRQTTTKKNTYEPIYTETFTFSKEVSGTYNEVFIKLMDYDMGAKDEHIGSLKVPITGEFINRKVKKWYKIINNKEKDVGEVELEIIFNKQGGGPAPGPGYGQGAAPVTQRALPYLAQPQGGPQQYPPPPGGQGAPPQGGQYPPPPGYQGAPPQGGQYPPPPGYQGAPPQGGQYPPPPGYQGAPPQGYGAPPPGYGAPPPGYGAPPPGYGAPGPAPIMVVQQAPVVIIRKTGPTRIYIHQKVFTWGDKFSVKDEDGNIMFWVSGDTFTIGKKLHILGPANEEYAYIHEKVLTLWAQYDIDIRKPEVMTFTVKREYKIGLGLNFNVLGLDWKMKGDFGAHDYRVFDQNNNNEIFFLHKKWCSWGDSYELIIQDPKTIMQCLCVALSIDAFLAKDVGNDSDHPQYHYHRRRHW